MENERLTPKKKPICAVLDTNVWIRERLLNSSIGAAFLYRLHRIGGRIGLPEVTETEIIANVSKDGRKAVTAVKNNLAIVRTLIGKTDEIDLPSDVDFQKAARDRLSALDDLTVRVDARLEHFRSALNRVIQGTPPNNNKEEFRDSLIWEAALELSEVYEVAFVTNDSGFYQDNKIGQGLAESLINECGVKSVSINLYPDVQSFLLSFNNEVPPLDYEKIVSLLSEVAVKDQLNNYATEKNFKLGSLKEHKIKAFITERREFLALEFELSYRIFDVQEKQLIVNDPEAGSRVVDLEETIIHPGATIVISGDCYFNEIKDEISDYRPRDIDCFAADGHRMVGGTGFLYATGNLGRGSVPYKLKRPVNE